ncbi:hypothetical protein COLSTE_00350 [Collinsella stercoris DSM 13279]|uniref:Uncharacterized protein n=1 Tax=Collinsella stercoris DSM 13279 TaxID=445975 RepID=B6G8H0_9ACTN|nr:hypothetical protein COLSTE_00350 [Collinsella stercoris DSM 13279]
MVGSRLSLLARQAQQFARLLHYASMFDSTTEITPRSHGPRRPSVDCQM